LIRLITMWPFPSIKIKSILDRASKIVIPELNLGQVSREVSRIVPDYKILQLNKIDGELITPEEIIEKFINHKTYVI
jgi:2-oxoglutarate ferredoxin oxidoreductase subunit alpha